MKSAAKLFLLRLISEDPEAFSTICRAYLDDPERARAILAPTGGNRTKKLPVDRSKVEIFDWCATFQGRTQIEIASALISRFSMPELRYASKTWRLSSKGKTVEDLAETMAQAIRTILV